MSDQKLTLVFPNRLPAPDPGQAFPVVIMEWPRSDRAIVRLARPPRARSV